MKYLLCTKLWIELLSFVSTNLKTWIDFKFILFSIQIIFISRLVSINNQLKSLFDDRGPGYYKPPPPHHVTTNFSGIPMHEQSKSVYNPNYEHNVLLLDPIAQESSNIDVSTYNALPIPPGEIYIVKNYR